MSAQSADPRSLFYPKAGWHEQTAPFATRFVFSADEIRLMQYQLDKALEPSRMAYAEFVERELGRDR